MLDIHYPRLLNALQKHDITPDCVVDKDSSSYSRDWIVKFPHAQSLVLDPYDYSQLVSDLTWSNLEQIGMDTVFTKCSTCLMEQISIWLKTQDSSMETVANASNFVELFLNHLKPAQQFEAWHQHPVPQIVLEAVTKWLETPNQFKLHLNLLCLARPLMIFEQTHIWSHDENEDQIIRIAIVAGKMFDIPSLVWVNMVSDLLSESGMTTETLLDGVKTEVLEVLQVNIKDGQDLMEALKNQILPIMQDKTKAERLQQRFALACKKQGSYLFHISQEFLKTSQCWPQIKQTLVKLFKDPKKHIIPQLTEWLNQHSAKSPELSMIKELLAPWK